MIIFKTLGRERRAEFEYNISNEVSLRKSRRSLKSSLIWCLVKTLSNKAVSKALVKKGLNS